MPIIKPIKLNHGDVVGQGEDVILTTGGAGNYGDNLTSHPLRAKECKARGE
ncbi:hypothetical protein [Piscirickettsia salmonis]|uniref:hypothetical protein n=1 Tax=Piscirickettsia salmonis TaxID=1238 RepID=UPI0007D75AFD|nr:hypothetical protein A0O36_01284 [Piscirickettsiaceae bacterium NZ-RLO1]